MIAGLRAVASQRGFQVKLTIDGAPHRLVAHQLVIADGRFHAGRPIVAAATADDRQLVVQAIIACGRWRLLRSLGAYLAGRDQIPDTLVVAGAQITLDCVASQQLEIDGELSWPARCPPPPELWRPATPPPPRCGSSPSPTDRPCAASLCRC